MRNLLRCRRGAAAFATVIALMPLIGVVALGGEAGSWYVTKQIAQNAADAAAYSGALRLECPLAGILRRYTDSSLSRQGICRPERVLQRGRHLLSQLQMFGQPSDKCLAVRGDQYAALHGTGSTEISFRPRQPDTAGVSVGNPRLDHRHHRRPSDCSGQSPAEAPMQPWR